MDELLEQLYCSQQYNEGYKLRKIEEMWEQHELEQASTLSNEPCQVFLLEDGTDLERA